MAPTTMYYSQSQASIVFKRRQRQCIIHKAKPPVSKRRQRQCTNHKAKPPQRPKGAKGNVLFTKPSLHSVQQAPTTMYYSQSQASIVSRKRQRQLLFTKDDRNAALKQFIDVFLLFCFIAPRQAYIKLCIHNLKSRRKDTSNQILFISSFVIEDMSVVLKRCFN